jgi:hypothetical protein
LGIFILLTTPVPATLPLILIVAVGTLTLIVVFCAKIESGNNAIIRRKNLVFMTTDLGI